MNMIRKISWKEYCYATGRDNLTWYQKLCCYYQIRKGEEDGGWYVVGAKMYLFWYVLLWPFYQLLKLGCCIWYDGLCEWEWSYIRREQVGYIHYAYEKKDPDSAYNRMERLWGVYD